MYPCIHGDRSWFTSSNIAREMRPMAGGGEDITVHVELLARRLMREQAGAAAEEQHPAMVTTHRVSRLPLHIRDNNAEAYTPGFAAIGPLHNRKDRRLRPAERLKVAYLNGLISRGYPDPAHHLTVIQEYVGIVAAREPEARALYAADEVANITPEDFIQMMVLDGCFIIEHLVNVSIGREEPALQATPFALTQLSVDLILAENQIPFFVLVDLISSTKLPEFAATGYTPPVLLQKLVLYYLAGEKGRDMTHALPDAEDVSHILHLLHAMITTARTRWEPPLEMAQWGRRLVVPLLYRILPREHAQEDVPSASDLKRMSVKIMKARGGGSGSNQVTGIASVLGPVPLAVKLTEKDRRLQLPQFRLEFRTAPLLLNLMAFEQSTTTTAPTESHSMGDVSACMSFMAKMVQSAEDVGVLAAAEVVQQHGDAGDENRKEVARFFRELGGASEADGHDLYTSYLGATLEALMQRIRPWTDIRATYITFLAELVTIVTIVSGVSTVAQTYASFKYH